MKHVCWIRNRVCAFGIETGRGMNPFARLHGRAALHGFLWPVYSDVTLGRWASATSKVNSSRKVSWTTVLELVQIKNGG